MAVLYLVSSRFCQTQGVTRWKRLGIVCTETRTHSINGKLPSWIQYTRPVCHMRYIRTKRVSTQNNEQERNLYYLKKFLKISLKKSLTAKCRDGWMKALADKVYTAKQREHIPLDPNEQVLWDHNRLNWISLPIKVILNNKTRRIVSPASMQVT